MDQTGGGTCASAINDDQQISNSRMLIEIIKISASVQKLILAGGRGRVKSGFVFST